MQLITVGIDLLWVRVGKVGGTESYIRNLLDGFAMFAPQLFKFILFVSSDNKSSFECYQKYNMFKLVECNISSSSVWKRILWEHCFIDRYARKLNVDVMFVPIYSKPFSIGGIPYIVTIHDLQALHYPEYFSKLKNLWMRLAWKYSIKSSKKIIAISNFVKEDIKNRFNAADSKIEVIYNPIKLCEQPVEFEVLYQKYGIEPMKYLYTVSSMLPHKNLRILLQLVRFIKDNPIINKIPHTLVISGIGGKQEEEINKLIDEYDIKQDVIITGFVSNEERDTLYRHAYAFLFPSLFEGFGMPPVEALMLGTPVITTLCASIPEVTRGKAIYVNNPHDVREWYEKLKEVKGYPRKITYFPEYEMEHVVNKYCDIFKKALSN